MVINDVLSSGAVLNDMKVQIDEIHRLARLSADCLWSREDIASYMGKHPSHVSRKLTCRHDFPPADGSGKGKRWKSEAVKKYIDRNWGRL